MAEGRRQLRSSTASKCIPEKLLLRDMTSDSSLIDEQRDRIQLRQRWELASVLNFIRVFRPVIPKDLKIPAEEIETALITANQNLGRIHIALLKGIPPINKSIQKPDAWITCVCRKLATWWSWVSEGENPLRADHGREILLYKQLDPTTRLLILKALCDIRAEVILSKFDNLVDMGETALDFMALLPFPLLLEQQDDILQFITDKMDKGSTVSSFRKERMEVGDSGVTYWYEGDPVIGYRLYREIGKTYSKQKAKGKGCVEPTFESQWETIALKFEDIHGIMDNLSSSKIPGEALVGEAIKAEILPVLMKIEKKKAQQERLARRLQGYLNCRVGPTRSCRDRRPAKYTFDEYDRSIEDAIRISTEPNNLEPRKANGDQYMDTLKELSGNDDDPKNSEVNNDVKNWDSISNYDVDNDDSDGYKDDAGVDDNDVAVATDSKKESMNVPSKPAYEEKHLDVKLVPVLRRSSRNFDAYHAVTKKRLRQRPTKNAGYNQVTSSDSEDANPARTVKKTVVELSSGDESKQESGEDLS